MKRAGALTAIGLALALAPSIGRAQPSPAGEARRLFDEGVAAADAGRYADAVGAFERSYRARASAVVLHNLAMAYRGVGRLRDAIDALERYLREPASNETPAHLATLRAELDAIRAEVPELRIEVSPPGAAVRIDGAAVGVGPVALRIDPGHHRVEVSADDCVPYAIAVDLGRSERQQVRASLEPTPADGRIAVEADVPTARILIDGVAVGVQRASVAASPGDHAVLLRASGYRDLTRAVHVGRHGVVRVDVGMQPERRIPAWAIGAGIAGAAAVTVAVVLIAVYAQPTPEPSPAVGGANYWGVIPLPGP